MLAYETRRDFLDCRLSFRWRSSGVLTLDAVNGPVLAIEGRGYGGVREDRAREGAGAGLAVKFQVGELW